MILPNSLYVATSIKLFHTIWTTVGAKHRWKFSLQIFFNRSFSAFTGCDHDLMTGSGMPLFFLRPGNTATSQSMLVTSSPDDGLVSQSTQWSTLRVGHTYPSDFTQGASPSHSIWITALLELIPMSDNASSTGTPMAVTTSIDISGSQASLMLTFLTWFYGPPINLAGGIFVTGTGSSSSILYFFNRTTGRWYTLF